MSPTTVVFFLSFSISPSSNEIRVAPESRLPFSVSRSFSMINQRFFQSASAAEIEKLKKNTTVVGDIEDIEGIGPSYGAKLRGVGLAWIKTFLERCATKVGREEVAASSGINPTLILTWANMADLLRLWGVTPDWAELLEAAGVDTVKEIKNRVPANLHAKLTEVNAEKNLARTVPGLEMVTSWVEQAKAIPPVISH